MDVTVVSFCQCRGTDAAIDLSVAAWTKLESDLGIGRIWVNVEDLRGGPAVTLPPTNIQEGTHD